MSSSIPKQEEENEEQQEEREANEVADFPVVFFIFAALIFVITMTLTITNTKS